MREIRLKKMIENFSIICNRLFVIKKMKYELLFRSLFPIVYQNLTEFIVPSAIKSLSQINAMITNKGKISFRIELLFWNNKCNNSCIMLEWHFMGAMSSGDGLHWIIYIFLYVRASQTKRVKIFTISLIFVYFNQTTFILPTIYSLFSLLRKTITAAQNMSLIPPGVIRSKRKKAI